MPAPFSQETFWKFPLCSPPPLPAGWSLAWRLPGCPWAPDAVPSVQWVLWLFPPRLAFQVDSPSRFSTVLGRGLGPFLFLIPYRKSISHSCWPPRPLLCLSPPPALA